MLWLLVGGRTSRFNMCKLLRLCTRCRRWSLLGFTRERLSSRTRMLSSWTLVVLMMMSGRRRLFVRRLDTRIFATFRSTCANRL